MKTHPTTLNLLLISLPVALLTANCSSPRSASPAASGPAAATGAVAPAPASSAPSAAVSAAADALWLKTYAFDAAAFNAPPMAYAPFTRWWWPGNDVTKPELLREVNLLADNGFGGVEIQAFVRGMNQSPKADELARIQSWDSPSYYENIRAVLTQARQRGLTVDMSDGSGWSTGGPHLTAEDNFLTLNHARTAVQGGKLVEMEVPRASMEHKGPPAGTTSLANLTLKYGPVPANLARLQRVVAARQVKGGPLDNAQTMQLDPASVVDLTGRVRDGRLRWQAPAGEWQIISFWAFPSGEMPKWIASADKGFVPNHFDSTKVNKNYNHLFGARTGLQPFYGNPLRAVFNDSYEFQVDRHYSNDLFEVFKKNRGYDVSTLLPANLQPGYNNHAEQGIYPNEKPYFAFSDQDWRIRYDYDLTLSDLLQMHFFDPSRGWLEGKGMLHRTQPYGLPMDVIAAAGNSSIPETEQLYAEGAEGFLKVVSSGAHLYNRPVTSAEAVVYRHRAEMTTPQKIKISVDKAFAAGVNQIIYHGTAYQYNHPDYGKDGWNPFDSPFTPFLTYSSSIKEKDNFWKHMKDVNQYVQRTQYALRAGKPKTDVLIYYPLLGVDNGVVLTNPGEILTNGYLEGVEPEDATGANKMPARKYSATSEWFKNLAATVNALEAAGVTWDLVNDASLQQAQYQDGQIAIRGNKYQAIMLVHEPYIQLASAQRLNELTKQGGRLVVVGKVPAQQPSFLNYAANDARTEQLLTEATRQANGRVLAAESGVASWARELPQQLKFADSYAFTRQIDREMPDGSRLKFLWNKSSQWQTIALTADASLPNVYWLDADCGTISKNVGTQLSYRLPPLSTVLLYATAAPLPAALLAPPAPGLDAGQPVASLTKWTVKAGPATATNTTLFDWRSKPAFTSQVADGVYTTTLKLDRAPAGSRYVLDLGTVYFTAEVYVNGQLAGKRLYAPYVLDITRQLKVGPNQLEVRVTPTQRNESIAAALKGDAHYAQYIGRENTRMPAGLLGPVTVRQGPAAQ